MTEREAQNQGFHFTGSCWDSYEKGKEDTAKKKAAKIKKMFRGADYRIVTGTANSWLGRGSKGIYGNDIYHKVQYYDIEKTLETKLTNLESRKQKLLSELAQIEKEEEEAKQEDAEIRSLLKK